MTERKSVTFMGCSEPSTHKCVGLWPKCKWVGLISCWWSQAYRRGDIDILKSHSQDAVQRPDELQVRAEIRD